MVYISFSSDKSQEDLSLEELALNYFIENIYNSEPLGNYDGLHYDQTNVEHFYDYGNGSMVIPDLPNYISETNIFKGFSFYSSGKIYESTTLPIHPDSIYYNPELYLEVDTSTLEQIVNEEKGFFKKQIEINYPIRLINSYDVYNNLHISRSFYIYVYKEIKKGKSSFVKMSLIGPHEGLIYERYNFYIEFDSQNQVQNWFVTDNE